MNSDVRKVLWRVIGAVVAIVLIILFLAGTYTLDETEQAVITQFGAPVGDPVTEPGLHFKTPFVQQVRKFERRAISWDGDPNQIPTRGREFISVDTTARWRVVDALQFLRSVRDEAGATSRLNDIIDSVVRDAISSAELVEIVRSRDAEISEEDIEQAEVPEEEKERLTQEVEIGREQLEQQIVAEAQKAMPRYGIELIDVKIKRLNYIQSVQDQVFQRMISERQRIAEQFRSEGEGEAASIRGETSREEALIQSEAARDAEVIRGQADADVTRIYSEAYSADPEFYSFLRTLQSYEGSLGDRTVLLLDADSDYFRYLGDVDAGR